MMKIHQSKWPLLMASVIATLALFLSWRPGALLEYLRQGTPLEKLTLVLFLIFLLPPLFERLRLPAAIGLLLGGIFLGPYATGILAPGSDVVDLFATLGRVFLMFIAGLEVDLRIFQQTKERSMGFGIGTFSFPLLAGIAVGWAFDFEWNAAVLIGSLLASHTLLGFPVMARLGLSKSEPMAVTLGATIFTDIAALLVLAVCISIHKGGFSVLGLANQIFQLLVYMVLVLQGLPWLGIRYFRRHRDDENAQFVFTFLAVILAAAGAHFIHLEDIVGAFLAGIGVNRVLAHRPVQEKVVSLGESLFIPIFFITIGLRLDLPVFASTLLTSLPFVVAILGALLIGKLGGALSARLLFRYDWSTTLTLWALSLPQVAATLAAAMAAFEAVNDLGDRLITESVLNGVIVLMVVTSVLGPVLTELFGKQLLVKEVEDAAN